VALVNEAMVRKHFAHENPLGQHIVMGQPMEIVGVVADAKLYGLDAPVEPAVYVPLMQNPAIPWGWWCGPRAIPRPWPPAVRREILKLDPEQPVSNVRTMETVLSDSLMLRRVSMLLLTVFASLALTLATVGIYGLTAYSVSRRTHEIGLRVALGASQSQILRLVVGRGIDHLADRRRYRGGGRIRVDARLVGHAIRRYRHRSAGIRRRAAAADRRFGAGQLCPGAQGHAHRSAGRAEI
jgi:putative ABC transport system permease protein